MRESLLRIPSRGCFQVIGKRRNPAPRNAAARTGPPAADDYVERVSATTGMPFVMVRRISRVASV
jgi:hypothetical protein